jgi:hypothetical protein
VTAGYRIGRLLGRDGVLYMPIVGPRGGICDRAEAARLAETPGQGHGGPREFVGVAADESEPRFPGELRLDLTQLTPVVPIPLHLGDSELVVGTVERLALRSSAAIGGGTVGRVLLATARLDSSLLADIAWTAIMDEVIGGLCSVVTGPERAGRCQVEAIRALRLGLVETSSLASAKILWISENAPPPRAAPVPWDRDRDAL